MMSMKPDELDALVDTIAERVRARINTERVGPVALPAAGHGAWYDESSLRAWLSQNVARIGSDGSTPSGPRRSGRPHRSHALEARRHPRRRRQAL
jgi:hypothetical protein